MKLVKIKKEYTTRKDSDLKTYLCTCGQCIRFIDMAQPRWILEVWRVVRVLGIAIDRTVMSRWELCSLLHAQMKQTELMLEKGEEIIWVT